ncbi:hypothetical protein [Alienimonas sp. DA493]|uniref:hypothetical protein n=1 Tax=Alienimonas sp. DA493 TaxID=3373605 RepID=UPI003754C451
MLYELFPLPARIVAAAVCLGLAWWAFGRASAPGEPDRRKPSAVWLSGFAAAWLVLAGDGFEFLFSRHAREWLPVVAVGIAGSWFVLRGTRGTPAGRRFAAGAVLLMIAAPFLSRLAPVLESVFRLSDRLAAAAGVQPWELEDFVGEGLGCVVTMITAGLIAFAAWRPPSAEPFSEPVSPTEA